MISFLLLAFPSAVFASDDVWDGDPYDEFSDEVPTSEEFDDTVIIEDSGSEDVVQEEPVQEEQVQEDAVSESADTGSDEISAKLDQANNNLGNIYNKVSSIDSKVDEISVAVKKDELGSSSSEGGTASGSESSPEASATDIYNSILFLNQSLWLLFGFICAFLISKVFLL